MKGKATKRLSPRKSWDEPVFQRFSHLRRFWIVAPVVVGSNPIAHPPKVSDLQTLKNSSPLIVRVVSEIVPGKVVFCPHHALTNILFIYNPIAVIHGVGFVTNDLLGGLAGYASPVHIPGCDPTVIVENFPRQTGFLACGARFLSRKTSRYAESPS